ncbi:MAG TPA: LicD family protein [Acidobacteriota bacterium]|nr:LicD family protein [Acidobacteriota bacterium]
MNKINAKKLLFTVADVLEKLEIEYLLYGGTFLGAVREKDFIPIDRDIDLAILQESLAPKAKKIALELRNKGVKTEIIDHRHKAGWDGTVYAIKFNGFNEHGDLSGFMKIKRKRAIPSHAGSFWLVHTARFLEELGYIEFYGRMFKCPKDVDGFLTEKYGDWRTPHKRFYNVSKSTCRKTESWVRENLI